uniref:protein-serine/threonine phosphatase n=1 Tax=Tetraselmis chuii TaxID=63592 RepID=A0A7S1SVM3_9CHLO|mmetsp:Transcript_31775/g.56867  ORF Transcript_31775/g.56867 Transcript_31775/m.56867 type:complete len:327 (+) Transcript_31775:239-1219(+)
MLAIEFNIKWNKRELSLSLEGEQTVGELKERIRDETAVDPKRQKLLGLKTKDKQVVSDDVKLCDLAVKPGQKLILMGTPDAMIEQAQKQAEVETEVVDDFDISEGDELTLELKDREEVKEKLQRRIKSVEVEVMNAPRPGKKCLVLDIDYTLFDLGSTAERPEELARPYLHEFLSATYQFYDIIIWSATSMKWVKVKMQELGVLSHPEYKITCMLDHKAMVTVHTEKYGVFDCKPLSFIWAKFPSQYTESNTVMLDDLRRNYVLNTQQGLVIRPFRKAHLKRDTDKELLHLSAYLTLVGQMDSLEELNHNKWESYMRRHHRRAGGS